MKLAKIRICNFRGFEDVRVDISDLTGFVGTNSSGKSTVLQAIQHLLIVKAKFTQDDFYMHRAQSLEIRCAFALTEGEREHLSNHFEVPIKYLVLAKRGTTEPDLSTEYYLKVPNFGDKLLDTSYVSSKTTKEYVNAAKEGRLPPEFLHLRLVGEVKEVLKEYLLKAELTPVGGRWQKIKPKMLDGILPDVLYIPAFENIDKHTTYGKTNFFGKMLQDVFIKLEEDPEYKRFKTQYENLTTRIFSPDATKRAKDITKFEDDLTGYINEILPTKVSLNFSVPQINDFMLKNFSIYLDDGVKTPVTGKGHGAQRAIIWSLLRYYLDNQAGQESHTIFLVEEPELYLHPQAQRVMLKTLNELTSRGQVVYSTHSPVFVDLSNPSSIRVVRKSKKSASIYTLPEVSKDDKAQLRYLKWMGDAHNEIFFAKSVILYEGATEKILLTHMNQNPPDKLGNVQLERKMQRPLNFDELGCQLISTGGKFSMPFFTKLLMNANIPFYVIYDADSRSNVDHLETNRHIENNVSKARKEGLNAGTTVHRPMLERDWKMDNFEGQKVENLYELLSKDESEWNTYFVERYTDLRRKLFNFAWSSYLDLPYDEP